MTGRHAGPGLTRRCATALADAFLDLVDEAFGISLHAPAPAQPSTAIDCSPSAAAGSVDALRGRGVVDTRAAADPRSAAAPWIPAEKWAAARRQPRHARSTYIPGRGVDTALTIYDELADVTPATFDEEQLRALTASMPSAEEFAAAMHHAFKPARLHVNAGSQS